jgi:4-amino-4-deoxy-L-arabinose transferase-like glycosyltransferase
MPLWGVSVVAVLLGLVLFVWDLGSIGLVDETPPLFAASARTMAESGDWLIPQVNGLPRYDKPPLVYWLMAALYSLPGQQLWDPWGAWSAALPSALASACTLLLLCLLTACWERRVLGQPQGLWLVAGLLYGLSPLVMLWSRIGVSDSLLTALVALAMVSSWCSFTSPRVPWWICWLALGLATLTKGPVALVLFGLCWAGYALLEQNVSRVWQRLRPLPGVLVSLVVAAPWYVVVFWREGTPFVESFFGYHNLQRFTQVVNRHASPWWFYGAMLLVASLPWSPLVLLGLWRGLRRGQSLARFAACWLLAVLLLFSLSATKLPSYWLPATPAAALLTVSVLPQPDAAVRWCLRLGACVALAVGVAVATTPIWLARVSDPDLVNLPQLLAGSLLLPIAVALLVVGALMALWVSAWNHRLWFSAPVLAVQFSWLLLLPAVFWPLLRLGDGLRSQPMRTLALRASAVQASSQTSGVPIAMLGLIRPSFHFYSRAPIAYEGTSTQALVDLSHRLRREPRVRVPQNSRRILVAAPLQLEQHRLWAALLSPRVDQQGRFGLWWLDLTRLDRKSQLLQQRQGLKPTWQEPRPERF